MLYDLLCLYSCEVVKLSKVTMQLLCFYRTASNPPGDLQAKNPYELPDIEFHTADSKGNLKRVTAAVNSHSKQKVAVAHGNTNAGCTQLREHFPPVGTVDESLKEESKKPERFRAYFLIAIAALALLLAGLFQFGTDSNQAQLDSPAFQMIENQRKQLNSSQNLKIISSK